MKHAFETERLGRTFGRTLALDGVDLAVPEGRVVGLIGRNGSGKTTLLRHVAGLLLPQRGACRTLGTATRDLGPAELGRMGLVPQESRFLEWGNVRQHLDYAAAWHPTWDAELERRLVLELDLDARERARSMSPGNRQKLALLLALCHRPRLALLDEPVAALDPIARERLLLFLTELLDGQTTVVVSSHVLRDVERVVDWIVCLDWGRVVASEPLERLQERYAEWRVLSRNGTLSARFDEPFVLEQEVEPHQARLAVRGEEGDREAFAVRHRCEVEARALGLERIFPLLLSERPR